MKKETFSQILKGIIFVVLGILVAIFGVGALDLYFGIVACAAGALLLIYALFLASRKQNVGASSFITGGILLTVGITLFTDWLSVASLIGFLVVVVLGSGAGLFCFGIYQLVKKEKANALINIVIGVVAITLAVLYMAVPEFRDAFWIIVGVVIALYGALNVVTAFLKK